MLALAVAKGDRVLVAAAETDDALDPLEVSVGLALVGVGGELGLGRAVGAAVVDDAGDAADVGLADNDTVLAVGDGKGQALRLSGGPALRVLDGEREAEDALEGAEAHAGRGGDGVGDGVARGDGDGAGASGAAEHGRDGNVPVEELLVGEDLDLGALVAAAALKGGGGVELGRQGGGSLLEGLEVGELHDLRGAVRLEDDDVVRAELAGGRGRGGNGGEEA